jgi:hypothetical protein
MVRADKSSIASHPRAGAEREESLEQYYDRLQRPKENQVLGDRRAPPDSDAEPRNFNWKSEGQKDRWGKETSIEEEDRESGREERRERKEE